MQESRLKSYQLNDHLRMKVLGEIWKRFIITAATYPDKRFLDAEFKEDILFMAALRPVYISFMLNGRKEIR